MYAQVEKTKENKSRAMTIFITQKKCSKKNNSILCTQRKLENTLYSITRRQENIYNATENTITRPIETEAITFAKRKSVTPTIKDFTAHHKVPWSILESDIKKAFQINSSVDPVFYKLEEFSGQKFPVDKKEFIKNICSRKSLYAANSDEIDKWIQKICWAPQNIFIGPETDVRLDDPDKRPSVIKGGDRPELDGHFDSSGNRTPRSQQSERIFSNKGLSSFNEKIIGPFDITNYDEKEWMLESGKEKFTNKEPNKHYKQIMDPYNHDIPQVRLDYPRVNVMDHQGDEYKIKVESIDKAEKVQVEYTYKDPAVKGPPSKTIADCKLTHTNQDGDKIWELEIPTPKGSKITIHKIIAFNKEGGNSEKVIEIQTPINNMINRKK
ncbi:hypothetical protein TW84_04515 [Vibrio neptunius]|uniref:hypothetical protein n=1 Tax=Vibrio neptunius TaxID=170651 RepID=UPI0005F9D256|nr:hypothetical protein [Vibrio neptunius]KJY93141.1 hypothetical protein TW84_04515 [Vibrio neptunius]